MGEKLRRGCKSDPVEALSKPGRYTVIAGCLEIKEVSASPPSRPHKGARTAVLVGDASDPGCRAGNRPDVVPDEENPRHIAGGYVKDPGWRHLSNRANSERNDGPF